MGRDGLTSLSDDSNKLHGVPNSSGASANGGGAKQHQQHHNMANCYDDPTMWKNAGVSKCLFFFKQSIQFSAFSI